MQNSKEGDVSQGKAIHQLVIAHGRSVGVWCAAANADSFNIIFICDRATDKLIYGVWAVTDTDVFFRFYVDHIMWMNGF